MGKRLSKWFCLGIVSFIAAILFTNVEAKAATMVNVGGDDIKLNKNGEELLPGEEFTGDTSDEVYNWYKFTMKKDGDFELKIDNDCREVNIYVFDKKGNEIEWEDIEVSEGYEDSYSGPGHCYIQTNSDKVEAVLTFELKKGTYYVEINPGWSDPGSGGEYSLTAEYESDKKSGSKRDSKKDSKKDSSKSDITVSIGTKDTPLDMSGEEMETGEEYDGYSSKKEVTWYTVNAKEDGILSFIYVTDGENTNFYLFDKKGNAVDRSEIYVEYGTLEDNDTSHIYAHSDGDLFGAKIEYEVEKGIYFVAVNPGWQDTSYGGEYVIVPTLPGDGEDDGRQDSGKKTDKKNDDKYSDAGYVWYYVGTESSVEESVTDTDSYFTDTYELFDEAYYHVAGYTKGKNHEEAEFIMTWNAPPAVIIPGETVKMNVMLIADGETETIFADAMSVYTGPYEDQESFYSEEGFENAEGESLFFVGSSSDSPYPQSVNDVLKGSLPEDAEEGDEVAIAITTNGSAVYYIYEYTEYDPSMEDEIGDDDEPRSSGNGGGEIYNTKEGDVIVTAAYDYDLGDRAWVGLVPTGTEYETEEEADAHDIIYSYAENYDDKDSDEDFIFRFKKDDFNDLEDGIYDLVLCDDDSDGAAVLEQVVMEKAEETLWGAPDEWLDPVTADYGISMEYDKDKNDYVFYVSNTYKLASDAWLGIEPGGKIYSSEDEADDVDITYSWVLNYNDKKSSDSYIFKISYGTMMDLDNGRYEIVLCDANHDAKILLQFGLEKYGTGLNLIFGEDEITNNRQDAFNGDDSDIDYFYFWSDTTLINDEIYTDVVYYCEDCNVEIPAGKSIAQMMINEIYARHGYIFSTQAIQDYFESKSWYAPYTGDMNAIAKMLNIIEQKNVAFLKTKDKK